MSIFGHQRSVSISSQSTSKTDVGSLSAVGNRSSFLPVVIKKICIFIAIVVLLMFRFYQYFRKKKEGDGQCHESVLSVANVRWQAIRLVNRGGIPNDVGYQIFSGSGSKLRKARGAFAFVRSAYGAEKSLKLFQRCPRQYRE